MAYSQSQLHNPLVRLPTGRRTAEHHPVALNPLISARNAHITRLYNLLLHLLSSPPSPHTSTQIIRAWRALAGCREVHIATLWRVGAAVIERTRREEGEDNDEEYQERASKKADWLKFCQDGREDRVEKFLEYVLALVAAGRVEFAVDELDAYLDNQPYHDSIALNTLYGQLALLLAQPPPSNPPNGHPAAASSSSSSSDSDSSTSSTSPRWRRKKVQGGSPLKRAKLDAPLADDYAPFLLAIQASSPTLFSKATERFKRAAHLEERGWKESHPKVAVLEYDLKGEAARWLDLTMSLLLSPRTQPYRFPLPALSLDHAPLLRPATSPPFGSIEAPPQNPPQEGAASIRV
ncbi:hypothetical protein JCM11641_001426 [Rhodosporidiobolus odoratus]